MKTKIYRQGDVGIQKIEKLPMDLNMDLKKVEAQNGLIILAHGELTGHHHSFAGDEVEKSEAVGGEEYYRIKGKKIHARLKILREWKNQVMVNHPKYGIIEFSKNDVTIESVESDHVVIDGKFAFLQHQEHNKQGIPEGYYKGAGIGDRVRQREYTPRAIRNNAD